jgi:accessory gene regulator B
MIERLVELLIVQQLNARMITKENISVYRYGYILMFEMSINVLIAFIIGYFFHELPVVIFFLFIFIPLRSYCGGYHAPKAWICIILSNAFIVCVVLFSRNMNLIIYNKEIFLLEIICIGLITVLAPIQSSAKKLNSNEKQLYKKYIKIILIIQVILEIFFFTFALNKYGYVIIMSHIIQVLALAVAHYSVNNKEY